MARYLYVVLTNCKNPVREEEFNRWYSEIHLPDVLRVPGFISASRYVNSRWKEGEPRFLALYEIQTDNLDATLQALRDTSANWRQEGRMFDDLEVVGVYPFEIIAEKSSALP